MAVHDVNISCYEGTAYVSLLEDDNLWREIAIYETLDETLLDTLVINYGHYFGITDIQVFKED